METVSALLALCAGNSPVTGEFPSQRPVTRNFNVFFDRRLNKRLNKQSRVWWFETPSRSSWRHSNDVAGSSFLAALFWCTLCLFISPKVTNIALASFTKEVTSRLAKRPLVFNWRLANHGLTFSIKGATVLLQGIGIPVIMITRRETVLFL